MEWQIRGSRMILGNGLETSPSEVRRRAQGKVNGTGNVNGTSQYNGLINGNGLVNGTGKVNGLGLTNGVSSVPLRRNPYGVVFHRDLRIGTSLAVLFLLLLPAFVFLFSTPPPPSPKVTVDGQTGDWRGIDIYSAENSVSNDNVNIKKFGVYYQEDLHLSAMVEVVGTLFSTEEYDGIYIFIDSDRQSDSGYRVKSIGADLMVEILGSGGITSSALLRFGGGDQMNWTSWSKVASVRAAYSDAVLEVQVPSEYLLGDFETLFYATDFEGNSSFSSFIVGKEPGSLLTEQYGSSNLLDIGKEEFMEIRFTAFGADITMTNISFLVKGNGVPVSVDLPLEVREGSTATKIIAIDTRQASKGDFISLEIAGISATSASSHYAVPVTIVGEPARAYVQSMPKGKRVDGLFDDWESKSYDSPSERFVKDSLNINSYAADRDENNAYFYMSVKGRIFSGSPVAEVKFPPYGGPGAPSGVVPVPRRRSGEDITRIYIDTNSSDDAGQRFLGGVYDYMIEIRGIYGKIIGKVLKAWDEESKRWEDVAVSRAERGRSEIECAVNISNLGGLRESKILFVTTDWSGEFDSINKPTNWSTRSGTRSIYLVEDTNNIDSNTGFSNQRKLFYDGSHFFSFYFDASVYNTTYEWSVDGTDWTNDSQYIFTKDNMSYASVWYNSSDSMVYIVADDDTNDRNVTVRNATISGTSIVWDAEQEVEVSSYDENYKVAFIAVNSSGYIWLASSMKNGTGAYNINVTYSTSPEDPTSWSSGKLMRATDVSSKYIYPIVLPLSSTETYVLWYADGNIEGRKCTSGNWGGVDSIATTASQSYEKGPSAVVDSSGKLHLVYINATGRVNYTNYTSAGGWGSKSTLDSGSGKSFPTMTFESANDNLYAFWLNSSNQISGKYSSNGGQAWSWFQTTANTNEKANLTSIYSCSLPYVSWQWEHVNDEVRYEKVPEFYHLLFPVVAIIATSVLLKRRKNGTQAQKKT